MSWLLGEVANIKALTSIGIQINVNDLSPDLCKMIAYTEMRLVLERNKKVDEDGKRKL